MERGLHSCQDLDLSLTGSDLLRLGHLEKSLRPHKSSELGEKPEDATET